MNVQLHVFDIATIVGLILPVITGVGIFMAMKFVPKSKCGDYRIEDAKALDTRCHSCHSEMQMLQNTANDRLSKNLCHKIERSNQATMAGFGEIKLSIRNLAEDLKTEIRSLDDKRQEDRIEFVRHITESNLLFEVMRIELNALKGGQAIDENSQKDRSISIERTDCN